MTLPEGGISSELVSRYAEFEERVKGAVVLASVAIRTKQAHPFTALDMVSLIIKTGHLGVVSESKLACVLWIYSNAIISMQLDIGNRYITLLSNVGANLYPKRVTRKPRSWLFG